MLGTESVPSALNSSPVAFPWEMTPGEANFSLSDTALQSFSHPKTGLPAFTNPAHTHSYILFHHTAVMCYIPSTQPPTAPTTYTNSCNTSLFHPRPCTTAISHPFCSDHVGLS